MGQFYLLNLNLVSDTTKYSTQFCIQNCLSTYPTTLSCASVSAYIAHFACISSHFRVLYKLLKNNATSIICGEGKLIVDHQGYHFRGTKDNKPFNFDLNYKEVHTLVIVTDCTFSNIYYNGEYYDLFPKRPSVGKLLLVVEEMHRLHENSWKQLPWLNEFKDEDGNLPPLD